MAQDCNPTMQEWEIGELQNQGQPRLQSKFKASEGG